MGCVVPRHCCGLWGLLTLGLWGACTTGPRGQPFTALRAPVDQCTQPGPRHLTRSQMSEDVTRLWQVLARGYAGHALAASPERWRAARRTALSTLPASASPRKFRDHLLHHLDFVQDNHLVLWLFTPDGERDWRATESHRLARLSAAVPQEPLDCPDAQRIWRLTQEGRAEPAWLHFEEEPQLACRGPSGRVELSTSPLSLAPLAQAVFERERLAGAPWLRLRSLGASHQAALDRFVQSGAEVRDEPVVVLDLRGNAGGSDRYLLRWFERLTATPLAYFETQELRSEATLQGTLNFWQCVARKGAATAEGKAWLTRRVARAREELEQAQRRSGGRPFRRIRRRTYETRPKAKTPFTGTLLLIVDRRCSSACETAVLLARQLPRTWVIGENTEGTMRVGEIGWFRLRHSGLWVSVGRRVHRDPATGEAFPEARGYLPDLWLDPDDGHGALAALVRCMRDPECAASLPTPGGAMHEAQSSASPNAAPTDKRRAGRMAESSSTSVSE